MTVLARVRKVCGGFVREDSGQTLPLIAVSMIAILGMAAFAVDIGRAVYTHRQLQAATDAAVLAAARAIPTAANVAAITGPTGLVMKYSAASGGLNARSTLPGVTVTSKLECLATLKLQGMACVGNVPYNAIQVTETFTLNTYFGGFVGYKTVPIATTSTAAVRGGAPHPSTIAVVLDTTLSMNIYDSDCSMTALQCELNGFQTLLANLNPCGIYQANCSPTNGVATNAFDSVAIFTFPNVSVGTASIDTNCTVPIPTNVNTSTYNAYDAYGQTNGVNYGMATFLIQGTANTPWPNLATGVPYSFPTPGATYLGLAGAATAPTYQITPFLSDYRASDSATTLNTSSALVKAAGGAAGCGSMAPANFEADYETYIAGSIYAAQSALAAAQAANPSTEPVMIILSDGDSNALQSGGVVFPATGYPNMSQAAPSGNYMTATSNGTYPSWVGECGQAITAAHAAAAAGTVVYSVGYGSEPSGCATDVGAGAYPNVTPCQTMAALASAPQYFYSDYNQSGSGSTCISGQPAVSLNGIFQAIAASLSAARLIPNNTT